MLGSKLRLNTATEGAYANSTLQSNTWYHVAVSVISGTGYFYVNGEPDGSSTFTVTPPATDQPFYIGRGYSPAAYDYFEGEMSNVQVWDAGLSPENITTLYNNGQPLMTGTQPEETNLKAWYKLNQSANWEADTVGEWQIPDAVSAFPQSFEFDGVSNEMTLPKGSITDTGAKSVSVWIKNEITSGTDYVFNSRAGGYLANGITLIQTPTTGYITSNSYSPFQSSKIFTDYRTQLHIPNDGKWHHMAWTAFPQAQRLKAYIDGVFVYEFIGTTTVDTTPSTDITVGQSGSPWTGKLSNFQIWDDVILSDGSVALNDPATGQIAELYNNGSPLTTAIESSNLKAWYKLDNSATFSTNWVVENSAITPNFDKAIDFISSSTQYVDLTNTGFPTGNAARTMSAWIKSDSTGQNNEQGILRYGTKSTRQLFMMSLAASNGQLRVTTYGDDLTYTTADLRDDAWHYVALTYDGTSIKGYVDGSYVGVETNTLVNTTDNSPAIGDWNNSGFTFNGAISNVLLYTETLTDANIVTLYNNGTPQITPYGSPFGWWKLDNLTTGIQDSGSGGNDGTLVNGPLLTSTDVRSGSGISSAMTEQNLVNNNVSTLNGESSGMDTTNLVQSNITKQIPFSSYSIDFDAASSDYVEIPNNDSFNFVNTNFSISIWLNPEVSHNGMVMSHYYGSDGWGLYYQSGSIRFYDAPVWTTVTTINTNEWTHVLIVGDYAGSNLICYKNGNEVYNSSHTFSITDANINLFIASERGTGFFYDGKISNTALFDRVLTEQEALKIYNNGVTQDLQATSSFSNNIIAWCPMDQSYTYFNGSVLVARDVISGNDGTGVNIIQENIVGNAPGSDANGTGTNLDLSDLIGDMKNSTNNSYSINMADYADGVTNPANSGRSTLVP